MRKIVIKLLNILPDSVISHRNFLTTQIPDILDLGIENADEIIKMINTSCQDIGINGIGAGCLDASQIVAN